MRKRWFKLKHLKKSNGPVNDETTSGTQKITNTKQTHMEANTSNDFTTSHCSRHYSHKMLPARTVNHPFLLILTSTSPPYKRTK